MSDGGGVNGALVGGILDSRPIEENDMSAEVELVTIWVGRFDSDARHKAYLREQYDEDDAAISEFARDQGVRSYDHDFVESSFHPAARDLAALLAGHSYSQSYFAAAKEVLDRLGEPRMNSIILVWGTQIAVPRSAKGDGYELVALGTFACDERAEAI